MPRPHTGVSDGAPLTASKQKVQRLCPHLEVCVCVGGTHVPLHPSQIGLEFQKVPYDLKNIISYLPLLPTFYLFIKLDILSCFFLFQVWPSLVCC